MAADQHNDRILFIGGLNPDTQARTLYAVFEKFGPLLQADQHSDRILFIGGLNPDTQERTLYAVFEIFGPLLQAILVKDRKTEMSRDFAFITFQHPADAKNAIREMNGKSLDGKIIKVEHAKIPPLEHDAKGSSPNCIWEGQERTRSHSAFEGHSGHFQDAPPATESSVNDGGNNLYVEESTPGDGYGRRQEEDSSTRNDGRQEFPHMFD